jgi:MFS family permease
MKKDQRRKPPHPSSLWHHPDFLKLWAGRTISLVGDQVSLLALPLTAVLFLKANAFQMGILTAAGSVPALFFALIAGVWVDRLPRRPVLVTADVGRCLLLCFVPLLFVFGLLRMEWLVVLAFLVGTLAIFFNVASPSYLPSLIPSHLLVEGNSKLELSRSLVLSLSPAFAGLLVQVLTAPVAIVADACSFLFSAASLVWIRTPETHIQDQTMRSNLLRASKDGIRFLVNSPLLRALTSTSATLSLFNSLLEAILVLYLIRDIGIQPALLGVVFAVGSIGFVVGALLCGRLTTWMGVGRVLVMAPIAIGISDGLLPLAGVSSHAFALFLVGFAQFGFGLACPLFSINQLSLRQIITPENLQGRMNGAISLLTYGLPTIGALIGGALGQAFGLPQTLAIAAVGEMVSSIWIYFSPVSALREHPHHVAIPHPGD